MKNHKAARQLVEAEKDLRKAREICTCSGVIDLIDTAYNKIYEVGDGLYPAIIKEMRSEVDPMM
jgi:hypothetical protein